MVNKTPKTDSEEIRDKMVHIAFTATEKESYKQHAKDAGETLSNFIRLAIEDKIRVIENPNMYKDLSSSEEQLREIKKLQEKQIQMQELLMERLKVVNGINETMEALKPFISKEEISEVCNTIISMLKVHKRLTIEKLTLLTHFGKGVIYDCISANKRLMINDKEEVFINE